ncbi:MAG: M48 family metalloprotease [Terriglobales bacterium]
MRTNGPGAKRLQLAICVLAIISLSSGFARADETSGPFKFTKIDVELLAKANQADQEFDHRGLVFDDPTAVAYIEEIGKKVAPEGPLENVKWRFRILRDAQPNAFALPNGTIYIHSGLLAMLQNEAQLAGILGHEVTHVVNRHSYLENRSARKKMATANIIGAIGGAAGGAGGIAGAASGVIGGLIPSLIVTTIYGYSRELEHEADVYGLRAMVRNGYSPDQMGAAFELLKSGYEVHLNKEARGLYTDHPRLDERIKYVSEMAETLKIQGEPVVRAAEYSRQMERVMRHDVPLEILIGRERTAVGVAIRLTEMNPESADNAYLLGEAYRSLGGRSFRPQPEELTDSAKGATRKQLGKMTLLEYENALRATPEGKKAWAENVKSAEKAYSRALTLEPTHARAMRGQASLYDEDGRATQALEGYRKYLELSPTAMDAYRIKKRIEDLEKASTANASANTTQN